ncbi:MAG: hypothetical protein ABIS59_04195 [Candidatus Saccharibacteria bacterium]
MPEPKLFVLCCENDGIQDDTVHLHGPDGRVELTGVSDEDIVNGPNGPMLPVSSQFGAKDKGIYIKLATADPKSRITPYFVHADIVLSLDLIKELASDRC